MIDTEQNITRTFDVTAAEDGSEDAPAKYNYSGRMYRPVRVMIRYRVNRGATVPYWYIWELKVDGQHVLKNGTLSQAYIGQHTATYRYDEAPVWLIEIAEELKPVIEPEIRDHRV